MVIFMMTQRKWTGRQWGFWWVWQEWQCCQWGWRGLHGYIKQAHRQRKRCCPVPHGGRTGIRTLDRIMRTTPAPLMLSITYFYWETNLGLFFIGSRRCTIRYRLHYPLNQWMRVKRYLQWLMHNGPKMALSLMRRQKSDTDRKNVPKVLYLLSSYHGQSSCCHAVDITFEIHLPMMGNSLCQVLMNSCILFE